MGGWLAPALPRAEGSCLPRAVAQEELSALVDSAAALKFLGFIFSGITSGFAEFRFFGPGRKPKVAAPPRYLGLPPDPQAVTDLLRLEGERMIAVRPAPRCRIPPQSGPGKDRDVL